MSLEDEGGGKVDLASSISGSGTGPGLYKLFGAVPAGGRRKGNSAGVTGMTILCQAFC